MRYFALGGDGLLYYLDGCENFESAGQKAEELKIDAVWLADEEMAKQWKSVINKLENEENEKHMTLNDIICKRGTRFKFVSDLEDNTNIEYLITKNEHGQPSFVNIQENSVSVGAIFSFSEEDDIFEQQIVISTWLTHWIM